MANEFVIKNGFFSQGTSNITGNLSVSQTISGSTGEFTSITGSLFGTASYASNGGVTQIVAGTNISISPVSGLGAVTINSTGGGGTPGGTDTNIQFNSGSTFSGSSNLTYNYTTNVLSGTTAQFTQITASFSGSGQNLTSVTASAINDTTGSFSVSNIQDGQYLKRVGNSIVGTFLTTFMVNFAELENAYTMGNSGDSYINIETSDGTAV